MAPSSASTKAPSEIAKSSSHPKSILRIRLPLNNSSSPSQNLIEKKSAKLPPVPVKNLNSDSAILGSTSTEERKRKKSENVDVFKKRKLSLNNLKDHVNPSEFISVSQDSIDLKKQLHEDRRLQFQSLISRLLNNSQFSHFRWDLIL
jgi:hypothetical protein